MNGTDEFHLDDPGFAMFTLLSGECGTEKGWFSIYNRDYIGGIILPIINYS